MPKSLHNDEYLRRQVAQYAAFEDRGVSLLSRMCEFAPREKELSFLNKQVEDEKKHARIFGTLAHELGIEEQFFNESLEKLYDIGQRCVDAKDWLACVTCQSVIEELAIASFSVFFQRADDTTRKILLEVIEDEKRHLEFALWQIQEWNKSDEDRKKILSMQEQVMHLFLDAIKNTTFIEMLRDEDKRHFLQVLKNTYAIHKQRFEKIGLSIPPLSL